MKPVIVVECANDELLLRGLKVPRARVQHEGNRDEVVKYVAHKPTGEYIGLVDADEGTQFGELRQHFKNGPAKHGVMVATHGKRELIVLKPFLEGWLNAAVKACGGRMSKLDKGLSDNDQELHGRFAPRGDKRMGKVIDYLEQKQSKHLAELRKALKI